VVERVERDFGLERNEQVTRALPSASSAGSAARWSSSAGSSRARSYMPTRGDLGKGQGGGEEAYPCAVNDTACIGVNV
jgi:hypothetical protein